MIKKNFLVIILLIALVLTLGVTSVQAEVVELEFWHVFSAEREQAVDEKIDIFNQEHENIEVSHQSVPGWYGGLLEQLQTYAVVGQLPDVTLMGLSMTNFMRTGFNTASLNSYIEEDNYDLGQLDEKMLSFTQHEDETYGFPYAVSTPLLFVNREHFDEAGIEFTREPETWEQVKEWAIELNNLDHTSGGIAFQMDFDVWQFQTMLESFGGEMADLEAQEVLFDEEPGQRVLQYWEELRFEEEAWPLMDGEQAAEEFLAGDLSMIMSTTGNLTTFERDASFDVDAGLLPAEDEYGNPRSTPGGGSGIFILAEEDERQQASWEFVKFMVSETAQPYVVEEMGYMTPNLAVSDPEGIMADFFAEYPLVELSYQHAEEGLSDWFNWPEDTTNRIESRMNDHLISFISGEKTAEEALEASRSDVEAILDW